MERVVSQCPINIPYVSFRRRKQKGPLVLKTFSKRRMFFAVGGATSNIFANESVCRSVYWLVHVRRKLNMMRVVASFSRVAHIEQHTVGCRLSGSYCRRLRLVMWIVGMNLKCIVRAHHRAMVLVSAHFGNQQRKTCAGDATLNILVSLRLKLCWIVPSSAAPR